MNPAKSQVVFRVIDAGMHSSFQDCGRVGMKRWGVPPSGAMDHQSLAKANELLGNCSDETAIEILFGGMTCECLEDTWIVITGNSQPTIQDRRVDTLRTIRCRKGDVLRIPMQANTLWTYLAVEGGWSSETWLGSQSVWPAGGLGRLLRAGDLLARKCDYSLTLPQSVGARYFPIVPPSTAPISVWPGPQWAAFSVAARASFFQQNWTISAKSNRAGYRLSGDAIDAPKTQMISEPTLIGSIQVPPDGQPIVLLNDGPTMGGYAKIAHIDSADLDRFRQLMPGTTCTFSLIP